MNGLQVVQLALNTSDLAGTLRLYSELFEFRNAGGNALWGETIRIQGLDPGSRSMIWWLLGDQPLFQLELFHHTKPPQRPQPADWRASDHGWCRFGVRVGDIERVRAELRQWQIAPSGQSEDPRRGRRLIFRDPFVGAFVEVLEEPGRSGPALAYVTYSVEDIVTARDFFGQRLGFPIQPLETLHLPEDEAMWSLSGAQRDGFVVPVGEIALELVHYSLPQGRPRGPDASIVDQGIMNVGLGSTDADVVRKAIAAFIADGCEPTRLFDEGCNAGTYFTRPDREFELLSVNEDYAAMIGFKPSFPFLSTLGE